MTQPNPTPNNHPSVTDEVIKDLRERERIGVEKYKTTLQIDNGRDSLQDSFEEALDLSQYLKQTMMNRDLCLKEMEELIRKNVYGSDAEDKEVKPYYDATVDCIAIFKRYMYGELKD